MAIALLNAPAWRRLVASASTATCVVGRCFAVLIRYYYWHAIVMVKRDYIKIMAMIVVVAFPHPS